jgi:4-hydroxy-2-oxoheptanedioate aldolase
MIPELSICPTFQRDIGQDIGPLARRAAGNARPAAQVAEGGVMIGDKLRARLAAGEIVTMVNPHHVSAGLAQRLVEHGADSVFLDCEHGTWSFEDIRETAHSVRGVGGGAIVRPHSHERPLLIRYLNAGADGLMVPMVNTAGQAAAVVEALRYAVLDKHPERLLVVMIETPEAIGIDVYFVGPSDLSQSMGFSPALAPGEARPPKVVAAIEHVFGTVRAAGKFAGTLVNADDIGHWTRRGGQFLYLHSDPFLRSGFKAMRDLVVKAE